jgi:hypothetical protein
MRFNRMSITKRGVELNYELRDQHKLEEIKAFSAEPPLSSFSDAMQAFCPFVIGLLEIPENWREALTITTLNLSEDKNGNRGLIVTAVKPVANAYDRPLVLNTPLVREGGDDPSEEACVLVDEVLELIALAESEAERYLNGEREQRELFDGKTAETSENAKEFDERAAHAENLSTRKPRRGRGKARGPRPADTGVDFVANPGADEPVTDENLREFLLKADRDVSVEAIAKVTSSEREAAFQWAIDPEGTDEPEWIKAFADPSLVVDGWQDAPPPKLGDEEVHAIRDAARGD